MQHYNEERENILTISDIHLSRSWIVREKKSDLQLVTLSQADFQHHCSFIYRYIKVNMVQSLVREQPDGVKRVSHQL